MNNIVTESDQKASVSPQPCTLIGYATVFKLLIPPSSTENHNANHLQPRSSLSSSLTYLFSALCLRKSRNTKNRPQNSCNFSQTTALKLRGVLVPSCASCLSSSGRDRALSSSWRRNHSARGSISSPGHGESRCAAGERSSSPLHSFDQAPTLISCSV